MNSSIGNLYGWQFISFVQPQLMEPHWKHDQLAFRKKTAGFPAKIKQQLIASVINHNTIILIQEAKFAAIEYANSVIHSANSLTRTSSIKHQTSKRHIFFQLDICQTSPD